MGIFSGSHVFDVDILPLELTYPRIPSALFRTSGFPWDMFLCRSLNTCILGFIFTTSTWDPFGTATPSLPCHATPRRSAVLTGCELREAHLAGANFTQVQWQQRSLKSFRWLFFVRVADRCDFFHYTLED